MEDFDANTDCITGVEISVEDVLKAGVAQPFDGNKRDGRIDWAYAAALGILKDLSWRNGIGKSLKDSDIDTRRAIVERLSSIAHLASDDDKFMNIPREFRQELHEKLKEANVRLDAACALIDEQEVHLSELSLELQDERSKRIMAQQDLEDVTGSDTSLSAAQSRLTVARAVLLELEADEKRGKISALEDQLSEVVAKADIAHHTRECFAARCKALESTIEKVSSYADKYRGSYLMCDVLDIVTGDESTPPPHSAQRIKNENERFKPRVLGADIQTIGGMTSVTVSETIEPDGTVDGPTNTVMVTTTGTDVADVLERHQEAVAGPDWDKNLLCIGDEFFVIRVRTKDGDRLQEAMRKHKAAESEAA